MKHKWPLTPLGEVLTERREIPSEDDLEMGRVRIIEKITFNIGRIQLRPDGSTRTGMILVQPGDLVVSGINAAKGAIAIYDPEATEPVAATIHYGAYIPNPSRVDVRFLWWMLRSRFFQNLLNEYVPGGIKTELKAKRLLPVPVPMPLVEEQKRIVARIEELAAQMEETRTLRHQATIQSDLVVESAAQVRLTALPQRTRLGDGLFKLIYRYPTFYGIQFTDSGVGLLKIGHLSQESWTINFEKQPCFISRQTSERFPRTVLEEDDLVMAVRGATIGKTAHVTSRYSGFNINPNLLRLQPNPAKLVGKFFWYFMCSPFGREQFDDRVTSTAKETITVPKLKSMLVPLPLIPEQLRIVAELDALQAEADRLKALQAETAVGIDALLPAILDRAFKGEL